MAKEQLIIIDTSSWIEALRKDGRREIRERVQKILEEGKGASCEPIILELLNGTRDRAERAIIEDYETMLVCFPISQEVWQLARRMAITLRSKGFGLPVVDLIIGACAYHHRAAIEHSDKHFEILNKVYPAGKHSAVN